MSWKEILKRVDIDLDEADKACCEIARGEFEQWLGKHFTEALGTDAEIEDNETCDEILERLHENVEAIKNIMSGKVYENVDIPEHELEAVKDAFGNAEYWTPILEELEMIIDNWEECKEGASKIKDDLKVKPEVAPIRRN